MWGKSMYVVEEEETYKLTRGSKSLVCIFLVGDTGLNS